MKKNLFTLFFILIFCSGLFFAGNGAYIFIKAQIAQVLLEYSWHKAVKGENNCKPWPWADFRPVARLFFPGYDYATIVVNSVNGTSLAFAPGHLDGSAEPGSDGNCVIFGHRETHFNILQHLGIGDELILTCAKGGKKGYKVIEIRIVDRTKTGVLNQSQETKVTLITCYPFRSILPGNKRFVVVARPFSG